GRVVRDAAILAQLVERLAAIQAGHLVGDGLDGAVFLDEVSEAGIERAGRGVVEEVRRHRLPLFGLIAIRHRLARRAALDRPAGGRSGGGKDEGDEESERNRTAVLGEHIFISPRRSRRRHRRVQYYTPLDERWITDQDEQGKSPACAGAATR